MSWPNWSIEWSAIAKVGGFWGTVLGLFIIGATLLVFGVGLWWVFVAIGFLLAMLGVFRPDIWEDE